MEFVSKSNVLKKVSISFTFFAFTNFKKFDDVSLIADNAFCDPDTNTKCTKGINIYIESLCIEKGCCFKNKVIGLGGCYQPKCIEGCQTCVNSVNCEECKANYYLTEDTKICLDKIIDNYYLDVNITI